MMHRIDKEKWHTIRREDAEHKLRYICDEPIHIRIVSFSRKTLARILFCHNPHIRRVGLMAKHDSIL